MSGRPDRRGHLGRLAREIHSGLVEARSAGVRGGEALEPEIRAAVGEAAGVLSEQARQRLIEGVSREASGLGPLETLVRDPSIEEVVVNGCDHVYVERSGRMERTPAFWRTAVSAWMAGTFAGTRVSRIWRNRRGNSSRRAATLWRRWERGE